MAEEITRGFNSLEVGDEAPPEKQPTSRAELEATIQSLVERGKRLHDEVETYVAAVLEKQKVGKVHNPVEYVTLNESCILCSIQQSMFSRSIIHNVIEALQTH